MATIELINNPVDGTTNPGGHLHATEVDNLTRAANGHGVVGHTESMTVTGGDRKVTVPAFNALVPDGSGGTVYVAHAGGDVTIAAADGSDPRTDIGTLDSAGNLGKTDGTPTTETGTVEEAPMPALANDEILLFKVRALANTVNIGTDKVVGRAIDISENRPFVKGASDLTAASALSLPDTNERYFDVTGATGITSISTRPAGEIVILQFDSTPTLTHNGTSLILQEANDLTAAAGDVITVVSEGSGNWREISRHLVIGTGAWIQIDTQVLSGAASSVSFQNIDTAFRMFRLTMLITPDATLDVLMRLNNDSSSSYYYQEFHASSATVAGSRLTSQTSFSFNDFVGIGNGEEGLIVVTIAKETSAQRAKVIASMANDNTSPAIQLLSGSLDVGSALISRIDIIASTSNFVANSRFVLEGNRWS